MSKVKKLIAVAVSLLAVCLFATSAFASSATGKQKLKDYCASKGYGTSDVYAVIDSLSDAQVNALRANQDSLVATVDAQTATIAGSNNLTVTQEAANAVKYALEGAVPGLTISQPSVTLSGNKIIVTATGANGGISAAVSKEITKSGDSTTSSSSTSTSSSSSSTASASVSNPITASGSSVIKATGDNSAVVLLVSVLGVAAFLGLAVRKNTSVLAA
jgi:hypothetical protein